VDSVLEKIRQFTHDQYSDENRLEARIQIYRFCEYNTNWHQWVFDNLDFRNVINVLELGCGNGALWEENIHKLPRDVSIILSDISEGMVDSARNTLSGYDSRFQFRVADACQTPFHGSTFQMVIANHMLYHIDRNKRIFMEISRLLTDNGFAYASTPSMKNLQELMKLAIGFSNSLEFDNEIIQSFNLENGEEVISDYFTVVEKSVYQNDVIIETSDPLLLYLASIYEGKQLDIYVEKLDEFKSYLESVIKITGEIRITNRGVLFKFRRKL